MSNIDTTLIDKHYKKREDQPMFDCTSINAYVVYLGYQSANAIIERRLDAKKAKALANETNTKVKRFGKHAIIKSNN